MNIRRIVWTVIAAAIPPAIAWVAGHDFYQRSIESAFIAVCSLIAAAFMWFAPCWYVWD